MGVHSFMCFSAFSLRSIKEMIVSILTPFKDHRERPQVTCSDTARNRAIVAAMFSLNSFCSVWWAKGPHAQTLVQAYIPRPPTRYTRYLLPMDDVVSVALDWKERDNMSNTTPLVLCLHGLGGNSSSRYLHT
jgi:predicted alpha/beta-fold hydrolase